MGETKIKMIYLACEEFIFACSVMTQLQRTCVKKKTRKHVILNDYHNLLLRNKKIWTLVTTGLDKLLSLEKQQYKFDNSL